VIGNVWQDPISTERQITLLERFTRAGAAPGAQCGTNAAPRVALDRAIFGDVTNPPV